MRQDVPHVVGVVGNDITNDSRVKKIAASAAAAGYRSTIVCYTASGTRRETTMGSVRVIKVPVPFLAKSKSGRVPSSLRPFNGHELATRHAGPRVHLLARRRWLDSRISDSSGMRRILLFTELLWTRVSLKVRHEVFRLRRRAGVEVDRAFRRIHLLRVRTSLRLLRPFRDSVPNIADYEIALGPVLEELEPDLIHAHDYHMIGIAVAASRSLRKRGQHTKVIYDAHEWIPGLSYPQATLEGWLKLERDNIRRVDGVIGVSPEQINQLQTTYQLTEHPTLVLNAPVEDGLSSPVTDIRSDIGVSGPIIAYHGKTALARGLGTLVEALQYLDPDVHVGILALKGTPAIGEIREVAADVGVEEKVHFLDYVPADQLAAYLATADLAVIPYLLTGNNDIALPNKLFEAIQADLPVLVSDMKAMSRFINETGVGEIFTQGSPIDLAEKAKLILKDPRRYSEQITPDLKAQLGWSSQAENLLELYHRTLDGIKPESAKITARDILEHTEYLATAHRPKRLAVGPRNMAGQAYAIAAAVQSNLGIPAVSFALAKPGYRFSTHVDISEDQWKDPKWQRGQQHLLANGFTHVLAESGTGLLGAMNGGFIDDQIEDLQAVGLQVGIVLHGSEIRDPDRHRFLPYSPYATDDDTIRAVIQARERLATRLERVDVPIFVTTPDLLQDIEATWLPVALDPHQWTQLVAPFRSELPTVLHLPTNSSLKGSEYVDPVLRRLDDSGIIRYLRPESTTAAEVPALIEQADIVVDQLVIGAYGLMSCQTMAAGRLAIANISDIGSLRSTCPVIHAEPDSLNEVLRELLDQRTTWASHGQAGREFVHRFHNGRETAGVLSTFLGIEEND